MCWTPGARRGPLLLRQSSPPPRPGGSGNPWGTGRNHLKNPQLRVWAQSFRRLTPFQRAAYSRLRFSGTHPGGRVRPPMPVCGGVKLVNRSITRHTRVWFVAVFALAFVATGCSETGDDVPVTCRDCDNWVKLTTDLGRYANAHPANSDFIAYSTIRKDPGAPDENRETDEDLWLLRRSDGMRFQLTDNDMGPGLNLRPRWSPSGTRIAFTHMSLAGHYEVWTVDIAVSSTEAPVLSGFTMVATDVRDPAWADETTLLLVRDQKVFSVDIGAPGVLTQWTFPPPSFATSESYVDRHPSVSSDGTRLFQSQNRVGVADISVRSWEVDDSVVPPDTLESASYVYFRDLDLLEPTYPILMGPDTLMTPGLLQSVPVGTGGTLLLGARRDSRFLDSTQVTYCDTVLTQEIVVNPNDDMVVDLVFRLVRSVLQITSNEGATNVFWTRDDGRVTSEDFPLVGIVNNPGEYLVYECILPFQVDAFGEVVEAYLEDFTVIADRGAVADTVTLQLSPGETTSIDFDMSGSGRTFVKRGSPGVGSVRVARVGSDASRIEDHPGLLADFYRASSDVSTIWELDTSGAKAFLSPVLGSPSPIQWPTLSETMPDGTQYLAYVSNDTDTWKLFVQELSNMVPVGDPVLVPTPGSSDNFSCSRQVFHPSWIRSADTASWTLLVSMTDCPSNQFDELYLEAEPWGVGVWNVWELTFTP